VAYAAQVAFIENDTLRGNVLFGRPWNEELYHSALRASDLETDIRQLPGGDLTEIGERGINLSGGQKQRVSLARALYADADVVLLDDCLSAVDAHVGEHIFRHAVQGMFGGKTVILVSNQLQFLPSADYVLALEKGVIREQGEFARLVSEGQDFSRLVESFGVQASDEQQKKEAAGAERAVELEQYRARVAEQNKMREQLKVSQERKGLKARLCLTADSRH
jgi:ATP-binding cassette subfamily C (CFTR/MRP) protein 1